MKSIFLTGIFIFTAIAASHAATEEAAPDVSTLIYQAEQHFNQSEFDEAIRIDEDLLAKDITEADRAAILMTLSSAYLEKAAAASETSLLEPNLRSAIRYAKACYDLDPTAWRALANQGVIYMRAGRMALADKAFSDAERIADTGSPYVSQMAAYHSIVRDALKKEGMAANVQKT